MDEHSFAEFTKAIDPFGAVLSNVTSLFHRRQIKRNQSREMCYKFRNAIRHLSEFKT